jgi:TfoX/Sxy family transcriptional regulator of competence genes
MAYDEALADRVRDLLAAREATSERRMFSGIAFMLAGNMGCAVISRGLMVRLDPDDAERALAEPHVGPMEMNGKPARGWILVAPEGLDDDEALAGWVDTGADFAASLPPK